jgi:hypothetical protein
VRHDALDALVGEPLCAECFDYAGSVLWNAHVPRLWERTVHRLYRIVARAGGVSTSELRSVARLSYMKVVEFQRRGLVHLHVVLRADGAEGPGDPPPPWLGVAVLARAVEVAAARADVAVTPTAGTELTRARWGTQVDVRCLEPADTEDAVAIAAYVAKYSVKTADGTTWLAHPIRSSAQIEHLVLRPHVVGLVRTAWRLGDRRELAHLRLPSHAHAFGYTGQFSSKSARFSTTFSALRDARATFARGDESDDVEELDFDGEWRFASRGYEHPEADVVARTLHEIGRQRSRGVPKTVPDQSPMP